MDLNEIIRQLRAAVFALDNLQVKGRDNLDILLGTMQRIDRQINSLVKFQADLEASLNIEINPAEGVPEGAEPAE